MKENLEDSRIRSLRDYEISPRPLAWEKIQDQIKADKRKSNTYWWARAAVLMLICLSGYLMLNIKPSQPAKTSQKSQPDAHPFNETVTVEEPELISESKTLTDPGPAVEKSQNLRDYKEEKGKPDARNQLLEDVQENAIDIQKINLKEVLVAEKSISVLPSEAKKVDSVNLEQQPVSVVIEYKAGGKTHALIAKDNQDFSNDDHTLKRLIDKVRGVNDGKLSLAYLREAKDDLLDLDLKQFRSAQKSENN